MVVPVPPRTERRRFDPTRAAMWVRRGTVFGAVALAIWVFASFGTEWVPRGMDTMPTIPEGSWCVIDRRASQVAVGSAVFVQVPGIRLLLSRVVELGPDTVTVLHPNAASTVPDSRTLGPLPRRSVRGVVCFALPSDGEPQGGGRGR